jgi:hypothetical protein
MESPNRHLPPAAHEAEISLAGILNILWRRRLFLLLPPIAGFIAGLVYGSIVTPLYNATATVRPGITAFRLDGGGDREWRLKDITRWFHGRMYRDGVAVRMGIAPEDAPPIRADFIERGLQNIQGGSVITLSCLDPDPQRAKRALDAGIDAFCEYAATDSVSNSIDLTRRGLSLQISERERQLSMLDTKRERLLRDLALAEIKRQQLALDETLAEQGVEKLEGVSLRMKSQLEELERWKVDLARRLAGLDAAAEGAAPTGNASSQSSALGVRPSALLSENEVFRGLATSAAEMRARLYMLSVRGDSLEQRISNHEIEIETYKTTRAKEKALSSAEIDRAIAEIQLSLDAGIPQDRQAVQMEIRERRVQLAALTPLERIGPTLTSEGAVRPRKRRAISILSFMGLLGGFVLAFAWDYLSTNRRQIFQA